MSRGIFRDVYLISRRENHIRDFFVKTVLKDNYTRAEIMVEFDFAGEAVPVECTLTDADGKVVAQDIVKEGVLSLPVKEPKLWNAESPYLYTLTLETPSENIYQKVGIRSVEVVEDVIHINGVKVKFKGVNRQRQRPGYRLYHQQGAGFKGSEADEGS